MLVILLMYDALQLHVPRIASSQLGPEYKTALLVYVDLKFVFLVSGGVVSTEF